MNSLFWLLPLALVIQGCGKNSNNNTSLVSPLASEKTSAVQYAPGFNGQNWQTFAQPLQMLPKSHSRYLDVQIKTHEGKREIKIVGLDLVLGGEGSHDVYKLIKKAADVRSLEIHAEKLEINDAIELASTDVVIKAKELNFGPKGLINTSAISETQRAGLLQNGVDGQKAGDITILTDAITHQGEASLIANGGNGQAAGPGQDGARGTNAHVVRDSNIYEYVDTTYINNCDSGGICSSIPIVNSKTGRSSGNGQDARVGGRPGSPGNAGQIRINKTYGFKTLSLAGQSGHKDQIRIGGEPGHPATTCKQNNGKTHSCVTARRGADAQPLEPQIAKGISTEIEIVNQAVISADLAKMELKYAEDLYRNNHLDSAAKELQIAHLDKTSEARARALLNQLALHQDYYGKPLAWTPNISFEVNYKAFEQEIKSNLKILYFAEWLNSEKLSADEKSQAIVNLQEELFSDINSKRSQITKLVNSTAEITQQIEEIKVAQNEFDFELKIVEKEILDEARQNLEVPFHKKALAIIKVASRSIPVGQPTFGAIGAGIDFIDEITQKGVSSSELLSRIPEVAKSFKDFDWKKANDELNSALQELHPNELSKLKTRKERLAYLEKVGDFANPIFKAIGEQVQEFKQQEVSKTKLDAEINKIKASHPLYQRLIKALSKLHAKKDNYRRSLTSYSNQIESSLVGIQENYQNIAQLFEQQAEIIQVTSSSIYNQTADIKDRAIDRLNYYHYLFSKSYEYRFLRPYHRFFAYDSLAKEIKKLHELEDFNTNSAIDYLDSFYMAQLKAIVLDLHKSAEKADQHILLKEYYFSAQEIAALNAGEKIFIDLTNFFGSDKEDVRLISAIMNPAIQVSGERTDIEMIVQHSGISPITKNGQTYVFEHANNHASNLTWISYLGKNSNEPHFPITNSADESIFRELFGINDNTSIFVRPSGTSFVSVQLKKGPKTLVENLALDIEYTASLKK